MPVPLITSESFRSVVRQAFLLVQLTVEEHGQSMSVLLKFRNGRARVGSRPRPAHELSASPRRRVQFADPYH